MLNLAKQVFYASGVEYDSSSDEGFNEDDETIKSEPELFKGAVEAPVDF